MSLRRKTRLPLAFFIALAAVFLPAASSLEAAANVVFFMADDLGWNDVGYHGSETRTPHIDRLAREGVELDRYYVFPVCSPTRAAFMTGRSPIRMGVDRPIETRNGVPLAERFLSQILQDAGYETMLAGKWHLGLERIDYFPTARGFDRWYGHLGPAVDYNTHIWSGGLDWNRNGKAVREKGYATELIAAEAARNLRERDKSKPTFLYVPFNAPHAPLQAPRRYIDGYAGIANRNRRIYAAMVEAMDDAVGIVLAALEAEGMADDTIVVWASDNGGAARFGADNAPLRGGKGGSFEGGIRVPALIHWPAQLEPAKFTQQITAIDWLPTLTAALGIDWNPPKKLDGHNMWPALKNVETVARGPTLIGMRDSYSVFHDGWKYMEHRGRGETAEQPYLFRILDDPTEKNNLADKHPGVVEEMAALLRSIPRAPTVAPDVQRPGPAGRRPGAAPLPGGGPGQGAGAQGWSEITDVPWVERAKRD